MDKQAHIIPIMGKHTMKTWWIFGFQWWGGLRPAYMRTKEGKCYEPIEFGLWKRAPKQDRVPKLDTQ